MKNSKQKTSKMQHKAPSLKATDPQVLELWVRAGGRCEFHGCPEYLLQDKLTAMRAKLADIAHIVARSKDGPRGDDPMPLADRNKIENLFLSCLKHHRMIDNKALVKKYPKELLLQYKQTHEERIRYVTNLGDEHETTVVRFIGKIRGNSVSISNEEIREAVLKSSNRYPRYLGGEQHIEIDLTTLPEKNMQEYWEAGIERINDVVERRLAPAIQNGEIRHLSLFAFARIPFLAHLGHAVGDKVPLDIYQKHRTGSEGWAWSTSQPGQQFTYKKERNGQDPSLVAVILSVSGQILIDQLPSEISDGFSIYALSPDGSKPDRGLMSSKDSLDQFRRTYASLLRDIEANHPSAEAVYLFPALPISAALIIGRELMRNVSPSLVVYDIGRGGFERAIEINAINNKK